ncbi:hypothetical protein MKZ38_003418 [Zalerion maritima]|uniref:Uncharacterized protein n=1 Tax=Zalerion maritima TaxID=339359 RepID=A0AAD5RP83_9PEZI|nr:hypothetical protein MKZ38_003418 [Zalerion maritima]
MTNSFAALTSRKAWKANRRPNHLLDTEFNTGVDGIHEMGGTIKLKLEKKGRFPRAVVESSFIIVWYCRLADHTPPANRQLASIDIQ